MGRAPCCEKVGLKRGRWTAEEDEILTAYIQANGEGSWRSLPKNAGLLRCGKSCRLRWVNYLKSDLKRGKFSSEEDETIIKLHSSLGNRWCLIASHLPGRTDNEIKNYWNSHLSRQLYNFRKIIQQYKQQVVVDQPAKSETSTINVNASKPHVARRSRSVMKKNKPHVPVNVLDHQPPKTELKISTTLSQEVDNGGGSSNVVFMPQTPPALEEDVKKDRETSEDIVFESFFSNTISDDLVVDASWDHGGEMLFTNDDVENWLIDVDDYTTGEPKVDQSPITHTKNTCDDQLQEHYSSMNMYTYNDVFDNLGGEWDDLDWVDDGGVEKYEKWDSEEEKLLSWLSSSDCEKTESVADSDKQDAFVEWLLS